MRILLAEEAGASRSLIRCLKETTRYHRTGPLDAEQISELLARLLVRGVEIDAGASSRRLGR